MDREGRGKEEGELNRRGEGRKGHVDGFQRRGQPRWRCARVNASRKIEQLDRWMSWAYELKWEEKQELLDRRECDLVPPPSFL